MPDAEDQRERRGDTQQDHLFHLFHEALAV
jgi:hypothetical protein